MRSAVFDRWTKKQMAENPDAVILHAGCGLDSRCIRVETKAHQWYDVDFPEVIAERKRYFAETERYHMIGSDIRKEDWLTAIPGDRTAVIVMEGITDAASITKGDYDIEFYETTSLPALQTNIINGSVDIAASLT